mgnify:CR=1 FL=1
MSYRGPQLLAQLEARIIEKQGDLETWFATKRAELNMPLYGSVDIRDANWKVAVVDANQYPAGFNNLRESDIGAHLRAAIGNLRHIHIWPESHTRNPAYTKNIEALSLILENEGYAVTQGILEIKSGEPVAYRGAVPDLILLNNDLTGGPLPNLGVPVLPSPQMGWYQRRKSDHFRAAQPFLDEVASILDIDPWLISTHWIVSEDKCLEKETCRTLLAAEIDEFLTYLQSKYHEFGIEGKPTLFVKNDAGT